MYEDKIQALSQNFVRLERQLRFAHRVFSEDGDFGRTGAIAAINAAVEFVQSVDDFRRNGLAGPLIVVSAALRDLDDGAQHPMLVPEPTGGRRPGGRERKALRAVAAATMELAMQNGMTKEAAARLVARHLQKRDVDVSGDRLSLTWGTVKRWRDELQTSPNEDFAVGCYHAIIESFKANEPPSASSSSIKQDLLDIIDGVLNLFNLSPVKPPS